TSWSSKPRAQTISVALAMSETIRGILSPKSQIPNPNSQRKNSTRLGFRIWDLEFGIWAYFYTMPQRRRRNHSRPSNCTNNRKKATRNGERPFVVRQSGNFDGRGGGFGNGLDGIDSRSRTSSPGRR